MIEVDVLRELNGEFSITIDNKPTTYMIDMDGVYHIDMCRDDEGELAFETITQTKDTISYRTELPYAEVIACLDEAAY